MPEMTVSAPPAGRMVAMEELPDFHIPHAEKIEWMIETNGWALEPVAEQYDSEPPTPAAASLPALSRAVPLRPDMDPDRSST